MAEIAEEEQGINILYVAIGFLQWFEDERSDVIALRILPALGLAFGPCLDAKVAAVEAS
jgi:hypothetical protein